MIATLLDMANRVRDMKNRGHDLGLTTEETSFYDALAENGSAKEVMKSDQLRLDGPRVGGMKWERGGHGDGERG